MRVGVAIFFCLIGFWSQAQDFRYSLRNYKAIDGLPQSQVRILREDKNGYLWVGTEGGGLARFDGRQFKVYTTLDGLQSNIVNHIDFDDHDNLWVAHPRGITRFDGLTFKKFEQPGAKESSARLRRLFVYRDTVFFMSAPGYIGKIHNDSVYYWSKPIFPRKDGREENLITFVRKNADGSLVFCINREEMFCRHNTGDFWIDFKEHFSEVKYIFDYQGRAWFITDKGYFILDIERRAFVPAELPVANMAVYHDQQQDVFWTSSQNHLLKEYTDNGAMRIDTVLRDVDVTQVLVDSEGNTWFGTDASGLYKYFIQDFDRSSSDDIRGVMAIYTDTEGARWIGTSARGLWKVKNGKVKQYSTPKGSRRNGFFNITQGPDGTLWVGSSEGIGKYDRIKDDFIWQKPNPQSPFTGVISIQFDKDSAMWLGVMGGGVVYRHGDRKKIFTEENGLATNWVMSLVYMPKFNTVFIGDEFGVSALHDEKVRELKIEEMRNTSVVAMSSWRDSLVLVSTSGIGVVIYDPQTHLAKSITTKEGLASDFIYFCAPDDDGYLWVGSEKGITRIKLNQHYEITENLHFDYDNGLLGVETNQNAYNFHGSDKLFGLIDGLYQFNDSKRGEVTKYGVHLTNVELSYGQYSTMEYADSTQGFFKIPANPSFPPDKNHVTFHFNRVDKRYPKSVKFKYRLEGFEDSWSLASSSTQATYSNLPPGDYVFKVLSTDNNGSWESLPLSYAFSVEHPFYATVWFFITSFIVTGLGIGLVLYLRVKQRVRQVMMMERFRAKEQENLRKEIARDFHDEMGNQLTRIINYVSLLRLKSQDEMLVPHNGHTTSHTNDLYTKVEDSAKYLYTGTRDFIWSIDPGNDELSKLFIHIRDFGEKLFEEKDIKFRAYNELKDPVKLQYGFSREANLIFKEVMTNAFKYSHAENVAFTLRRVGASLFEFCFEDDGVGFVGKTTIENAGGLKNIHERAAKINATLRITSVPDKGTRIVLSFSTQTKLTYGLTV